MLWFLLYQYVKCRYVIRRDGIRKQGQTYGNPVMDRWAGAVMRKPLAIQKCYRTYRKTDGPTASARSMASPSHQIDIILLYCSIFRLLFLFFFANGIPDGFLEIVPGAPFLFISSSSISYFYLFPFLFFFILGVVECSVQRALLG